MNYLALMEYLVFYLGVMISAGIIKDNNLMNPIFWYIQRHIENKKLQLFFISMFSGFLPIPGRVLVSAGILDSISDETKDRSKLGVIDYISTHHYYLWSPLEKTVILPMAALGISYSAFIGYTWPLVLISFLFIAGYILYINNELISLKTFQRSNISVFEPLPLFIAIGFLAFGFNPGVVFALTAGYYILRYQPNINKIFSYINWKLLLVLIVVLLLSTYFKGHIDYFKGFISNETNIYLVSLFAFLASWLMGSSGKYAGIVALIVSVVGPQYLMWFLTIEFAAYNLSPTHKCVHIGRMYFNTPIKDYFIPIGIWQGLLVFYAYFATFL